MAVTNKRDDMVAKHGASKKVDLSWLLENEDAQVALPDKTNGIEAIGTLEFCLSKLGLESCVATNDPTPSEFATKRLSTLLMLVEHAAVSTRKQHLAFLVQQLLQPYDAILKSIVEADDVKKDSQQPQNTDTTLRRLQLQVMLRLQFWSSCGGNFVRLYSKLKLMRRKNKKRQYRQDAEGGDRNNGVLSDIVDLLSLTAVRLPEYRPFAGFVQGCLHPSFYRDNKSGEHMQKAIQYMYDYFEVSDPHLAQSVEPLPFLSFPMKFVPDKSRVADSHTNQHDEHLISSQVQSEELELPSNKSLANETACLLKSSKPLLAPVHKKRNSLLANDGSTQRSRFVGSHFNTDVSSLFRQVKVANKVPTDTMPKPQIANTNVAIHRPAGRKVTISEPNKNSKSSGGVLPVKKPPQKCLQVAVTASLKRKGGTETPLVPRSKTMRRAPTNSHSKKDARQVVAAARSALQRNR